MASYRTEAVPAPAPTRRHDLDLMRALVVLGLVVFHTARIFSLEPFYVSNDEKSFWLTAFVAWGVVWGMPLMFFISGQTTRFSLTGRSVREFLGERFRRLMVPFLFGMLILVPPHLYLWLRSNSTYQESYREFLPRFFRLVPAFDFPWFVAPHPDSMLFEAAHLYFLYFLFVFTVLALPLFLYLQRGAGQRWITRAAAFFERPGAILLLGLPVGAIEAALQSENYGGWNRYVFLLFFLYGWVIASDSRFNIAIRRHASGALVLAIPATALGFAVYVQAANAGKYPGHGYELAAVLWRTLKGVGAWWWIIAILGLGGTWLQAHADGQRHRDSSSQAFLQRAVRYANEAVLPFYVLHHLAVVVIGFHVVRWETSVSAKYLTISLASLLATLAVYECIIKRTSVLRFLLGMRPQGPAPR